MLTRYELFHQMRDLLSGLYYLPVDAQRVARDAGLELRFIAFGPTAFDTWRSILEQAESKQRVLILLNTAAGEQPENQPLQQARVEYQLWVGAGRPLNEREQRFEVLRKTYHLVPPWNGAAPVPVTQLSRLDAVWKQHAVFGGRDEELAKLDAFLSDWTHGYRLVEAPPGYGKSALLAQWIRTLKARGQPVCYTFVNRSEDVAGLKFTMQNLCEQLAAFHGVRGTLPGQDTTLRTLYPQLLQLSPEEGKTLAVVLDGLDEALEWKPSKDIFPSDLPQGVHVVFSARDVPGVNWLAQWDVASHSGDPLTLGLLTLEEVPGLLQSAGGEAAKLAAEVGFVEAVYDVSQGDPLYLHFLVQDVRDGEIDKDNIGDQPTDLDDYLAKWWQQLAHDIGAGPLTTVLGILSVSRGRLRSQDFGGISPGLGQSLLFEDFRLLRYLTGDADRGYAIAHPRFREYLTDKGFKPYEVEEYRKKVLDYCRRWQQNGSVYAMTHYAWHLADAVQRSLPEDILPLVKEFVDLASKRAFQQQYMSVVGDLPALQLDLERAIQAASATENRDSLPLVVRSAFSLLDLRARALRPDPIFTLAREGGLQAAVRRLDLFDIEAEWRQAIVLTLAWLACDEFEDQARALRDAVQPERPLGEPLGSLWDWLGAALDGTPGPEPNVQSALDEDAMQAIVERMAGSGDVELLQRRKEMLADVGLAITPELQGKVGYLSAQDGPHLVAYARKYGEKGDTYLKQYVDIHSGYAYPQYRNRSLWLLLDAVVHHPDAHWVRRQVETLAFTVLGGLRYDFREGLPVAVAAVRAVKTLDLAGFDKARQAAYDDAEPLTDRETGPLDVVGAYKRRLAAYAEALKLVLSRPGDDQAMEELLARAQSLNYGFAGYGMTAYLTLAEAVRICRLDDTHRVDWALDSARASAHNINDDTYCARSTARLNAMRQFWWGSEGIPDLRGVVSRFRQDPMSPEFATLHVVGESYEWRDKEYRLPSPAELGEDNTLQALAIAYKLPLTEFQRVNDGRPVDLDIPDETLIRVPDPGFAPLLAARFAAEALAQPALSPQERRLLIQSLVPLAGANPTQLDTVLARLVLADPATAMEHLHELEHLSDYPLGSEEVKRPLGIPA